MGHVTVQCGLRDDAVWVMKRCSVGHEPVQCGSRDHVKESYGSSCSMAGKSRVRTLSEGSLYTGWRCLANIGSKAIQQLLLKKAKE